MTSLLHTSLAQPPPHMRSSYVRFIPAQPRDLSFPVGRLDFVDETSHDDEVEGLRPQGDGHDSASEGAADSDDRIQDVGLKPEVEIKRRKMDSDVEVEEDSAADVASESEIVASSRAISTTDRGTITADSCVKSASTTMNRCVHVVDKLISTSSQQSVDRGTLTMRPAQVCHRATETDSLADSSEQRVSQLTQTSASVFQLASKYVETEPLPVVNKYTSTEQPFQMDKVSHLSLSLLSSSFSS